MKPEENAPEPQEAAPENQGGAESAGVSRRGNARAEQRRADIFQAAIELFAKHGLDMVTVEQIAARADVAKGTFFSYFPNKEAVLIYFAAAQVERLQKAMQRNEITGTAPERIRQVICLLSSHPSLTPELGRGLFVSIMAMKRPAEFQGPSVYRMRDVLAAIIVEGQERGLFRADLNSEETALFLLGQHFLSLLAWCSGYWEGSLMSVTETFIDLALKGLAVQPAPPGD